MIPDTYSEVGSLVVGRGPYCGNCGRVQGDHCVNCSDCDAVGVLCSQCFTAETKQHAEATQHDPAGNLLNDPAKGNTIDPAKGNTMSALDWQNVPVTRYPADPVTFR